MSSDLETSRVEISETKTYPKKISLTEIIDDSDTRRPAETEHIQTHLVARPHMYTDIAANPQDRSPSHVGNTRGLSADAPKDVISESNSAQSPTELHTPGSSVSVEEMRPQTYTDFNPTPQISHNTPPETTSPTKDSKKNLDGDLPPQIFGGYSPTGPIQYDSSPTYVPAQRPQTLPVVVNYNPGPSRSDYSVPTPDSIDGSLRLQSATSNPSTHLRVNENLQESEFPTPPPPYTPLDPTADASRNVITAQPRINYVNRDGLQKGIIYSARPRTLTCPHCLRKVLTKHRKEIGVKVHLVGIGCLLLGCMPLCVLAYVTDYLKDDNHYCPACGRMIGTEVPVPN